jgi:hypothetical protein
MVINFAKIQRETTLLGVCSTIKGIISKYIGNLCETFSVKCYKRKNTFYLNTPGCFK